MNTLSDKAQQRTYFKRFAIFLKDARVPFSMTKQSVFFVDTPDVTVTFEHKGVKIRRPHLPTRLVRYTTMNFDRVLALTLAKA
jgi:hypothetical protein